MKTSTAKAKGRETENILVRALRNDYGLSNVERRRLQGVLDKGDICGWVKHDGTDEVVSEVKSGAVFKVPQWLRELKEEVKNAKASIGFLAIRLKGQPKIEDWVVMMPFPEFMELMRRAGYLD